MKPPYGRPHNCPLCKRDFQETQDWFTVLHTTPNGGLAVVHEKCMLEQIEKKFYDNAHVMVCASDRYEAMEPCTIKAYAKRAKRADATLALIAEPI